MPFLSLALLCACACVCIYGPCVPTFVHVFVYTLCLCVCVPMCRCAFVLQVALLTWRRSGPLVSVPKSLPNARKNVFPARTYHHHHGRWAHTSGIAWAGRITRCLPQTLTRQTPVQPFAPVHRLTYPCQTKSVDLADRLQGLAMEYSDEDTPKKSKGRRRRRSVSKKSDDEKPNKEPGKVWWVRANRLCLTCFWIFHSFFCSFWTRECSSEVFRAHI